MSIRSQVAIAASVAYMCSTALAAQDADSDKDAATALQRCVGDVLTLQLERLDRLIAEPRRPRIASPLPQFFAGWQTT